MDIHMSYLLIWCLIKLSLTLIFSDQESSSESPLAAGVSLTIFSTKVARPYAAASTPERIRVKIPMGLGEWGVVGTGACGYFLWRYRWRQPNFSALKTSPAVICLPQMLGIQVCHHSLDGCSYIQAHTNGHVYVYLLVSRVQHLLAGTHMCIADGKLLVRHHGASDEPSTAAGCPAINCQCCVVVFHLPPRREAQELTTLSSVKISFKALASSMPLQSIAARIIGIHFFFNLEVRFMQIQATNAPSFALLNSISIWATFAKELFVSGHIKMGAKIAWKGKPCRKKKEEDSLYPPGAFVAFLLT